MSFVANCKNKRPGGAVEDCWVEREQDQRSSKSRSHQAVCGKNKPCALTLLLEMPMLSTFDSIGYKKKNKKHVMVRPQLMAVQYSIELHEKP